LYRLPGIGNTATALTLGAAEIASPQRPPLALIAAWAVVRLPTIGQPANPAPVIAAVSSRTRSREVVRLKWWPALARSDLLAQGNWVDARLRMLPRLYKPSTSPNSTD
jgi:hypothetical protein